MKNSNSVGFASGMWYWLWENIEFFKLRFDSRKRKQSDLKAMFDELDQYAELYAANTGKDFRSARIFEVGYGASPTRLLTLSSLGFDARGIDLDRPVLSPSIKQLLEVYRKNGIKRFIKSAVRAIFFDGYDRRALEGALKRRGFTLAIRPEIFLVGDVAEFKCEAQSIDFVYSEDVFEHIPAANLAAVCAGISRALSDDGIALISPSIFTGICGGHLVEWYPHTHDQNVNRQSEPWEHLRKRRFHADCYLNEMTLDEYKKVFEQFFEIVDLINIHRGRGSAFLTDAIREELFAYPIEELTSDKWMFVLRKSEVT